MKAFMYVFLMIIILSFPKISLFAAHNLEIKGPDTINITVGETKKINSSLYSVYFDGKQITDTYPTLNDFEELKNTQIGGYTWGKIPNCGGSSKNIEIAEDANYYYVKGNKPGTGYIILKAELAIDYDPAFKLQWRTASFKTEKKVKVNISKGKSLNVNGWQYDYSTRNKYFTTKIINYSPKPLTILSEDAIAINKHYKSLDRKLTLTKKKATIKPYKTVTVKFKVKGKQASPYWNDYYIRTKFLYNKKKYSMKIYPCKTLNGYGGKILVFINNKWVNTSKFTI